MSRFFVGVAFLRGTPSLWGDALIMRSTAGPFVHSEFFLQSGPDSRFYTAVDAPPGTLPSAITPTGARLPLPPGEWATVRLPVSRAGYLAAYAMLLELISLPIPYNRRDLWQCAVKVMLPFERDLDCARPATWVGPSVFCSQLCLLLLRRLVALGHVAPPPGCISPLFNRNSRGCSPNDLHRLLTAHAGTSPPERRLRTAPTRKKEGRNTACAAWPVQPPKAIPASS